MSLSHKPSPICLMNSHPLHFCLFPSISLLFTFLLLCISCTHIFICLLSKHLLFVIQSLLLLCVSCTHIPFISASFSKDLFVIQSLVLQCISCTHIPLICVSFSSISSLLFSLSCSCVSPALTSPSFVSFSSISVLFRLSCSYVSPSFTSTFVSLLQTFPLYYLVSPALFPFPCVQKLYFMPSHCCIAEDLVLFVSLPSIHSSSLETFRKDYS